MVSVIDVDEPQSWPTGIADLTRELATRYQGSTKYTCDLPLSYELEDEYYRVLDGKDLRAYHCTRLLPHEIEKIHREGLRLLTPVLVTERINEAQQNRAITAQEAADLHKSNVFAQAAEKHRENQVCLILSRNTFRHVGGVEPLLSMWGGEGIYMTGPSQEMEPRLRQIGKPAIVCAFIDLASSPGRFRTAPLIHKVFVGALLGLEDVGADVFYKSPVPPENIEAIWTPGDPDYDSFEGLPR